MAETKALVYNGNGGGKWALVEARGENGHVVVPRQWWGLVGARSEKGNLGVPRQW